MLNARILAEEGTGDTMIANTYAAYQDLPADDKKLIANLRARHCLESSQRIIYPDPTYAQLQRWQTHTSRVHPVVWRHRSGEESLLIGATAYYIEGMGFEEGRALLCRLKEFATQPQYVALRRGIDLVGQAQRAFRPALPVCRRRRSEF